MYFKKLDLTGFIMKKFTSLPAASLSAFPVQIP